jgi:hypothetical protein
MPYRHHVGAFALWVMSGRDTRRVIIIGPRSLVTQLAQSFISISALPRKRI